MSKVISIPNGSILNCFLPKKKGSLKRFIMNAEAKLIQKQEGFEKLLNHTALIEYDGTNVLIWEASVIRGVAPTDLDLYSDDAVFFITHGDKIEGSQALSRLKKQSGKKYDVKSWVTYLKYIVSGKWTGKTSFSEYSKKWYCSELVDYSCELSETPYKSTPNHVYKYTKHNEIWSGTYLDLRYGLINGTIKIK